MKRAWLLGLLAWIAAACAAHHVASCPPGSYLHPGAIECVPIGEGRCNPHVCPPGTARVPLPAEMGGYYCYPCDAQAE